MTDRTLYDIIESDAEPAEPCEHLGGNRWVVIVEPCVHGNTGRHIDEDTIRMKDWVEGTTGYEDCEYDWCDGEPEADDAD